MKNQPSASEDMNFTDLDLHPKLQENISARGFTEATPVQSATIPLALSGKDIIACAKTGSGKTLAFALPLIHRLLAEVDSPAEEESAPDAAFVKALILGPTRELALQIEEEISRLVQDTGVRVVSIFGGVDYDRQRRALADRPQIIVATPGRLLDYLKQNEIDLSGVTTVVFDEADRMLDMGFIDDVKRIMRYVSAPRKQMSLFSATLDYGAIYSVWEFMEEPEEVLINPELIDHSRIKQTLMHLSKDEKLPYLIQYIGESKFDPVIIFTNTKTFVEVLVENLNYHNIPSAGLSSVVNQKKRIRILEDFKERKFRVLVATDVASRGLHIDDVQQVINYDIPQDPESYVHRIGRTARAGKDGEALSICSEMDYENLSRLESYLKYKINVEQPVDRYLENLGFIRTIRAAGPARPVRREAGSGNAGRRDSRPSRQDQRPERSRPPRQSSGGQSARPPSARPTGDSARPRRPHNQNNRPAKQNLQPVREPVRALEEPRRQHAGISVTSTKSGGFWTKLLTAIGLRRKPTVSARTLEKLEAAESGRRPAGESRNRTPPGKRSGKPASDGQGKAQAKPNSRTQSSPSASTSEGEPAGRKKRRRRRRRKPGRDGGAASA